MAHQLPLFFLQRGRLAEALSSYQQVSNTVSRHSGSLASSMHKLMSTAAKALPPNMRTMALHMPGGAAGATFGLTQGLDVASLTDAPAAQVHPLGADQPPVFFDCWWAQPTRPAPVAREQPAGALTLGDGLPDSTAAAAAPEAPGTSAAMPHWDGPLAGAASGPLNMQFLQPPPLGRSTSLMVWIGAEVVFHFFDQYLNHIKKGSISGAPVRRSQASSSRRLMNA